MATQADKQVTVTRDIAASPEQLWSMVSDMTRMGEWSPENVGGEWLGDATAPTMGAKFRGSNERGKKKWKTEATVTEADAGRVFAFAVSAGPVDVAEWRYTFEPTAAGCHVTETWIDKRGAIPKVLGKFISGVGDRATHNREGMETTLERLAAVAEATT